MNVQSLYLYSQTSFFIEMIGIRLENEVLLLVLINNS